MSRSFQGVLDVALPIYKTRLLTAVIGYLAIYVLGTNAAWALRTPKPGRFGRIVELGRLWGSRLLLGDIVRLVYYLVVPYLVLQSGLASPLDFGLAKLDWIRDVGIGSAFGLGSLCLLVLIWRQYVRCAAGQPVVRQAKWLEQPWGWAFALREAILLESWWALCRSPMLLWTGAYFGVYFGLAIVVGAALLNARVRHELATPSLREEIVLTGSLAAVTATLYVFVPNLWLCIAVHFCLRVIVLSLVLKGMKYRPLHSVHLDA